MKTSIVHVPKSKAFRAVKSACKRLDFEIERADFERGRVSARSGGGILSFGNKISITISERGTSSLLRVTSKSAASVQLIDWGTNSDIEADLMNEIKGMLFK